MTEITDLRETTNGHLQEIRMTCKCITGLVRMAHCFRPEKKNFCEQKNAC